MAFVDDQKLSAEYAAEEMQFEANGRRSTARAVKTFQLLFADAFGRVD